MTQQNLVSMANQIADFFRFQSDAHEAEEKIAGHLNHFWAPTMRRDLVDWVDHHAGEGLSPLVKQAVETYRAQLLDRLAHVPKENELETPRGGGDAG